MLSHSTEAKDAGLFPAVLVGYKPRERKIGPVLILQKRIWFGKLFKSCNDQEAERQPQTFWAWFQILPLQSTIWTKILVQSCLSFLWKKLRTKKKPFPLRMLCIPRLEEEVQNAVCSSQSRNMFSAHAMLKCACCEKAFQLRGEKRTSTSND